MLCHLCLPWALLLADLLASKQGRGSVCFQTRLLPRAVGMLCLWLGTQLPCPGLHRSLAGPIEITAACLWAWIVNDSNGPTEARCTHPLGFSPWSPGWCLILPPLRVMGHRKSGSPTSVQYLSQASHVVMADCLYVWPSSLSLQPFRAHANL